MPADLEHREFLRHLNTKFIIRLSETAAVEAELTSVSEHMVSTGQEQFSIVFRTSSETFLDQGTRRFEHDQIEAFDLFIVPIARDDQGTYYEAVFNRLTECN